MSELGCQAAVGLLHVHDFSVCSQDVELPEPEIRQTSVTQQLFSLPGISEEASAVTFGDVPFLVCDVPEEQENIWSGQPR